MALTRKTGPSAPATLPQLMTDHLIALQVKGYSEYTVRPRRVHINMFVRWCAGRGIHAIVQITRRVLQDYERYVFVYRKRDGQPLTVASRFARLVPLRVWFRWMVRERILKRNLANELDLPRIGRPLPRSILSPKDVERIMRQTNRRTAIGLRDRCILEVLYATGVRRLELTRLAVRDLQLDRKTGSGATRKGKSGQGCADHESCTSLDRSLLTKWPTETCDADVEQCPVSQPRRQANQPRSPDVRHSAIHRESAAKQARRVSHLSSHDRDPHARERRRHPHHPTVARARGHPNNADLHSGGDPNAAAVSRFPFPCRTRTSLRRVARSSLLLA